MLQALNEKAKNQLVITICSLYNEKAWYDYSRYT